jgi:phospholipase C
MVIVMENHGYAQIIGSPTAPYLNALAQRYGLATASYATAHPSLPNYLELVSGSTQGVTDDCTPCVANAPQIVDQLQKAGIGWRAYMEAAPSSCFTGSAFPFDRHHDPFVYAPHIVDDPAECGRVVPFATFGSALSDGTLPPFVWVTPDVEHDMHTGTVAEGDAWLRTTLSTVLSSAWYRDDGAVIVTFDESTGGTAAGCCTGAAGGHVVTLVVSSRTPHDARMSTPIDGAGILRTVEAIYGLPYLGAAANPKSGTILPLVGLPRARGG